MCAPFLVATEPVGTDVDIGEEEDSRDGGGDRQQECPDSLCRDGALLQCSHSTEGPLPRTWILLGSLLCASDDSK